MKGFIFGLIFGAAGAIAGLHYMDVAHINKIHELAGIEPAATEMEAEDPAPAAEDTMEEEAMDEAVDAVEDAVDEAAEEVEEAVEEMVDEVEEAVEEAVEEVEDAAGTP